MMCPMGGTGKLLFGDHSLREALRKDVHLCEINVLQHDALGGLSKNGTLSYLYT